MPPSFTPTTLLFGSGLCRLLRNRGRQSRQSVLPHDWRHGGHPEFRFFEDAVRTALAALSDLAQPIRSGYPLTPANLTADSTSYASAFTAIKNVNLTWQAVSDAAGYNVYRSDYPHSGFVQITSSPVQGTGFTDRALAAGDAYYYVVTSVWPGGAESNFPESSNRLPSLRGMSSRQRYGVLAVRLEMAMKKAILFALVCLILGADPLMGMDWGLSAGAGACLLRQKEVQDIYGAGFPFGVQACRKQELEDFGRV